MSDIPEVEEETTSSPEPSTDKSHYKATKPPLVNGLSSESSDFEEIFLPEVRNGEFGVVWGFLYKKCVKGMVALELLRWRVKTSFEFPFRYNFGTLIFCLKA